MPCFPVTTDEWSMNGGVIGIKKYFLVAKSSLARHLIPRWEEGRAQAGYRQVYTKRDTRIMFYKKKKEEKWVRGQKQEKLEAIGLLSCVRYSERENTRENMMTYSDINMNFRKMETEKSKRERPLEQSNKWSSRPSTIKVANTLGAIKAQ